MILPTALLLDLQGGGIRSMSYDPKLDGYLITNETYTSKSSNVRQSQILFWTGNQEDKPQPFHIPELVMMNNIEGISPVTIDNKQQVLIVSDNGDLKRNRPANYMLLDYEQLTGD